MAGGQPLVLQRTRSWRKASRPYRPDLGQAHAGNREWLSEERKGKGEGARSAVNRVETRW